MVIGTHFKLNLEHYFSLSMPAQIFLLQNPRTPVQVRQQQQQDLTYDMTATDNDGVL